jgi:hypothetical protein
VSVQTQLSTCADAFPPLHFPPLTPPVLTQSTIRRDGLRPHGRGRSKNIFLYFLVVAASLKREKQISVFGFQSLRSPSSPSSPSSSSFAGEAARRRRFFRPTSPSHPSKLYSSLGWLNSKVPKPFPPFSLRLIDVDGF